MGERGSALIVVLWAMVLLGVGVLSVLHATRLELRVANNHGDLPAARRRQTIEHVMQQRPAGHLQHAFRNRVGKRPHAQAQARGDNDATQSDVRPGLRRVGDRQRRRD